MNTLFKTLASSTGLVQRLIDFSTWLLARTLQMPEPMVHAVALFLFVQVQAIENDLSKNGPGKNLCPIRLARVPLSRRREIR